MKKTAAAGMIVLALSLFATSAGAVPTVTITSPEAGATISRATSPKIDLSGTASFDTPMLAERQFFLWHAPCANATSDERALKTSWSNSDTQACGYNGPITPLNEVGYQTGGGFASENFAMQDTQLPLTLDATKPITGILDVASFNANGVGTGVGLTTVDFLLRGTVGGSLQTIGTTSVSYQQPPGAVHKQVAWSITPGASFDKKDFTTFELVYTVRGVNALHGYVYYRGLSHLTIPLYTASFNRKVEVAVDNGAFSATGVTLAADQATWTASINTPAAGSRTLKARAVQGGAVSGIATKAITVTA